LSHSHSPNAVVRLACGRLPEEGSIGGWQLQFLALEALNSPPLGGKFVASPMPARALRVLVLQLYCTNPVDAEAMQGGNATSGPVDRRDEALYLCSAAIEVLSRLAQCQAEDLVCETQVVWALCWLSGLPAQASPDEEDLFDERLRFVADGASSLLHALFQAGRAADAAQESGASALAHLYRQKSWLLGLTVVRMAPIEVWGNCAGDKAVIVLQIGDTRRLIFDRWEPSGPMFVQTQVQVQISPQHCLGQIPSGATDSSPWYLKLLLYLAAGCPLLPPGATGAHCPRILVVGLGGGTLASAIHSCMPHASVEVVEMEASVVQAAYCCFGLPKSPRMRVHVTDAYGYLERSRLTANPPVFDAVLFDIHTSDDCRGEWEIASTHVMELLQKLLRPDGSLGIYCGAWHGGDSARSHGSGELACNVAEKMRERWSEATILASLESGDQSCVVVNRRVEQQEGKKVVLPSVRKGCSLPFDANQLALATKIVSSQTPWRQ
jgi:hypothetical protein